METKKFKFPKVLYHDSVGPATKDDLMKDLPFGVPMPDGKPREVSIGIYELKRVAKAYIKRTDRLVIK